MGNASLAKRALHFNTQSYPRFGRGVYSDDKPPSLVSSSPYFWWFRFLRLNADYQSTEKNNGIGLCSDLYRDFGAISNTDFKTWWTSHSHLFAEQQSTYRVAVAQSSSELAPFNSTEALNVVVPLSWSQKSLKKHFSLLISKYVAEGKKGVVADTNAKYRIGSRWNIGALRDAYIIYTIRQANMARGAVKTSKAQFKGTESAKFQLAWADVAIRAKLKVAKGMIEGKLTQETSDKRRILTILANRHYKKAMEFIQTAASQQFP